MSVAVSDSPTGPFTDALPGSQLVYPSWTKGKVGWDDIDPTVWIETDAAGVEHRYYMWGNSNLYLAEIDEDMISITGGQNGITELTVNGIPSNSQYTEALWIYRRPDDDKYYLFFASNWCEELSYAVSDNIYGPYEYSGIVMAVGATSNTNHPSVIDFKGQTYIIYHTGAMPNGNGFLRSVCVDRLYFEENGGVYIQSVNKMGYYITDYRGFVKLLHDDNDTTASLNARTFIPEESGEGVACRSVSSSGKYLNVDGSGNIVLSETPAYFKITEKAEQK